MDIAPAQRVAFATFPEIEGTVQRRIGFFRDGEPMFLGAHLNPTEWLVRWDNGTEDAYQPQELTATQNKN